ncbi:glycoside hydrolase family 5 protein [Saccharata proteae CBS 121410]|uniref:mannan endo-1,4-beta-mannosidase n=1 Tax=Saccharata proteae CBS 121410 TaxID=1314787 RepID=A0A9P4HWA1_9PEZI|nr:glycoside hydrolase family 5 protein [Saccharata proteae CBS 121410]
MHFLAFLSLASVVFAAHLGLREKPKENDTKSYCKTAELNFSIDGEIKYYAGTNIYWMGFQKNDADVDKALDDVKNSGLKMIRVWGFNDVNKEPTDGSVWFQSLVKGKPPVINTGVDGLQRLDYVVKGCEDRGIKMIINFVNNWTDYGGMAAYLNYYGGSGNPDWYKKEEIQSQYKAYIQAVVSRYKNSKAVFAWELANEPRCHGCDTSVIYDWAESTSKYIKSLDSNHMVCLGDEGFGLQGDGSYPYTFEEGIDFEKNIQIETLDFATFHLYPASWGVTNDFGNEWVQKHGDVCAEANKPCLLEEYGVKSDKCNVEMQWQNAAFKTKGIGADCFWDFGAQLSTGKSPDDGNTIFYGTSDYTCLVNDHVKAIG